MGTIHCMFCNGKDCKYENYRLWLPEKGYLGINAIEGLYSTFITPNILAMQRPSTRLIQEYDLINVFNQNGIKSVFNLQTAGEHASCGDGIEKSSGFSYLPEDFIDSGISYYNFGWTDMDTPNLEMMLNIVNVMGYALENGKKISVHCHAGLGRTGLSIACYLVYSENLTADAAISLVRGKRPLSVQTKKQSQFVHMFENYLKKIKISYYGVVDSTFKHLMNSSGLTFEEALLNQRQWVVNAIIIRVVNICSQNPDEETEWYKALDTFIQFEGLGNDLDQKMVSFQQEINSLQWGVLDGESDVTFLMKMLLHWLTTLKEPIISDQLLERINEITTIEEQLKCMTKEQFETINFILKFFRELPSISRTTLDHSFERFAIYLTSQKSLLSNSSVISEQELQPAATISSTILDSIKSLRSQPNDKVTLPQNIIYQEGLKSFKAIATTVISINATMTMNASTTLDSMGFKNLRAKTPSATPKPQSLNKLASNSAPLSDKVLQEPELQPLTTLSQILSSIYKSYTLSETNEAIVSSTRQTLFPMQWSLEEEIGMRVKVVGQITALSGEFPEEVEPEVCDLEMPRLEKAQSSENVKLNPPEPARNDASTEIPLTL